MSSDQISLLTTIVTGFAALVAIGISVWQSVLTRKAITQDSKFEEAETVRHFTELYFQFVEHHQGKITVDKLKAEEVSSGYWSLLSTEYYFYRQGAIPPLMFASWVVDVAEFYAKSADVWKSHSEFLESYEVLHDDMKIFFDEIYKLSDPKKARKQLHNEVRDFVYKWANTKNAVKNNMGLLKYLRS